MPAQLPRPILAACPPPGTPDGCLSFIDQRIWRGWRKQQEIEVFEVRLWSSPADRENKAPAILRVDRSIKGGEFLAIKSASKGAHPWVLKGIRAMQASGLSARETIQKIRHESPCVVEIAPEPTTYVKKSSAPGLYLQLWRAGLHLAALVCDLNHGDQPGSFERKAPRNRGFEGDLEVLTIQHVIAKQLNRAFLAPWFAELAEAERKAVAVEILRATINLVRHPPKWRLLAGTARRCAHFVRRNSYTGAREPRSAMWSTKDDPSCLDVLAKRWLGPDTEIARITGTTESGQLAMWRDELL